MDSPIFGSQKSTHNNKNQKTIQYATTASDFNSSDWYLSNKTNSNLNSSQISKDLKFAYTLLLVQKNIKTFSSIINKCLNKRKYQSFQNILICSKKSVNNLSKVSKQQKISNYDQINNPQAKPLTIVCINKVTKKLQNMYRIINRLKLKNINRAFSRLYINNQKNYLPMIQNYSASHIESDLGITSKIQNKKRQISKRNAKQMKQNSNMNRTSSQLQIQNEKLSQQILSNEQNMQSFRQKMNNLLAYHESILTADSDRQTWLSDNGVSYSSFQHHIKPSSQISKTQANKKR